MSWVKLTDDFRHHPKAVHAGARGRDLWVSALGYCKRFCTDGFVPARVVLELLDEEDRPQVAEIVQRLLDVVPPFKHGLLERDRSGGYRIHDYAELNLTRAELAEERASAARRQRDSRGRRATVTPTSQRDAAGGHGDVTPPVTASSPCDLARAGVGAGGRPGSESESESDPKTEARKTEKSVSAVVSALRPLLPDVDLEGHVPFWLERFIHLDIVAQVTELRGKYGRKPVDASRVSNWLGVAEAKRLDAIGRAARAATKPITPEVAAAVARIEEEDWDALTKDLP